MMLADPSKKYRRMYQRVDLPDRQWPNNEINQAPIWMSTDLRDGKTASERLRELTDKLHTTAAGLAGQLREFAAHVRDYLTGADAQRPGVSALEQSGGQLARAGRELEQERQPLDALIRQHDRAYAEKLREQQPEPEPHKKTTRYYGPSM
jgi:hypothetical protein